MISFKKTYVPTGVAHELNFNLENIDNEGKGYETAFFKDSEDFIETLKEVTKELIENVEAFIIIEDGVNPDLSVYDFENILVLNPVEFGELKNKKSLEQVIASATIIEIGVV